MKHLFVSYELGLILKEKGFNEPCIGYWWDKEWLENNDNKVKEVFNFCIASKHNELPSRVSAPLYQQVVDWFREKHNLHIEINSMGFGYVGTHNNTPKPISSWSEDKRLFTEPFEDYYDALNKSIEEAIKLIP